MRDIAGDGFTIPCSARGGLGCTVMVGDVAWRVTSGGVTLAIYLSMVVTIRAEHAEWGADQRIPE
jgi:hypothetical protein